MVLESRWWPKNDVPVELDEPVDEPGVLGPWFADACPGIVSAAVTAKTPTAAIAPTAIHVVISFSRPKATSRAVIRASGESTIALKGATRGSEQPWTSLRTPRTSGDRDICLIDRTRRVPLRSSDLSANSKEGR